MESECVVDECEEVLLTVFGDRIPLEFLAFSFMASSCNKFRFE